MDGQNSQQPVPQQQPVMAQIPAPYPHILIMVLIGLMMFGVGLGGGYFLFANKARPVSETLTKQVTPTTITTISDANTTSWNTLKNETGFSLQYPPTYKVFGENMTGDAKKDSSISLLKMDESTKLYHSIYIFVTDKSQTVNNNVSLQQIVQNDFKSSRGQIIKPVQEISVDNNTAYTYSVLDNGFQGKDAGIAFIKSEKPEEINVIEVDKENKHYVIMYINNPINERIISTFTFTANEVGLGETCLGRSTNVCSNGLNCRQAEGSAADAPGICVKR